MNVSKLSISQETISRLNATSHLSKKRKREIRVEGVKALIRSKPAGHLFKLMDLIRAAGYHPKGPAESQYWAGQAFISGLIKKGIIVKDSGGRQHKSSYSIPEDVTVKKIVDETKKISKMVTTLTPSLEEDVKIVERSISSLLNEDITIKDEPVSTGLTIPTEKYCFEFKITKRVDDEYGRKDIAQLSMNDVNPVTMSHMVNEVMKNI